MILVSYVSSSYTVHRPGHHRTPSISIELCHLFENHNLIDGCESFPADKFAWISKNEFTFDPIIFLQPMLLLLLVLARAKIMAKSFNLLSQTFTTLGCCVSHQIKLLGLLVWCDYTKFSRFFFIAFPIECHSKVKLVGPHGHTCTR